MKVQPLIQKEIEAILNIPIEESAFNLAVTTIAEKVHQFPNAKVITSGVGKAGLIARGIAEKLCSTGTPAVFLHPLEAQHGDLGIVKTHDPIIIVSNSGETRELIELVDLIDRLPDMGWKSPIIAIVGKPGTTLAGKADVCLFTGRPKEICPLGLTPTTSTTVMGIIGDLLVVKLMDMIKFTKGRYNQRHHGGYLGKASK